MLEVIREKSLPARSRMRKKTNIDPQTARARVRKKTIVDEEIMRFAARLSKCVKATGQNTVLKILEENGQPMNQSRLSHYMSGRNYPDPPVLAALAKAVGVSTDYLLFLTATPDPVADLEEKLATSKGEGKIDKLMAQLSREQKKQVFAFAEYLLVQAGRADEIARSNQAGWDASMTIFQRKYGEPATNELLNLLADNVPELGKLVGYIPDMKNSGYVPPPKDKRINDG